MKIEKLMEMLCLGTVVKEPMSVSGGLLHKMYRVTVSNAAAGKDGMAGTAAGKDETAGTAAGETEMSDAVSGKAEDSVKAAGEYAVKVLNPEIMKRPEALRNMIGSEKIAKALAGLVPAVAALEIEGKQVHCLEGEYCLVYPWIEGMSVFGERITRKHCEAVGSLLGRIHRRSLRMEGICPEGNYCGMYDWEKYLQRAKRLNNGAKEWAAAYENALEDIKGWNEKACAAGAYLAETQVISHRDLDPKNVMWREDEPCVIDWEAAGYVNPFQEFLEVVNYWADDGTGELVKERLDGLVPAYCQYMDIGGVRWDEVSAGSYIGMLGWLEYNVKRALGIEAADESGVSAGEKQAAGTIRELYAIQRKLERLRVYLSEASGCRRQ